MATMESQETRAEDQSDSEAESVVSRASGSNPTLFLDKVRQSNEAVQAGDYPKAVALYSEAIALDPNNHILYSNRSAAHSKLGHHDKALEDARKAREINPSWSKAYYREGVALQGVGKDADALAAFAAGLAADAKSTQLLKGMVEATMKSPLKDKFGPIYNQLVKMKLDQSPFVIISVIGQELLSAACFAASLVVLESALRIGTCSLKLRGSVFSALSSAHWGLGSTDKAIACMLQDLAIAKSLGDQEGECRAHGNLGASYFAKGNYKEALTHHRFQLVLAMRLKDRRTASSALSSLGHVYTAIGDYPNALASHKQCVLTVKQDKSRLEEAREIGNVGAVYLAMGDFDSALECHNEHLKISKQLKNRLEEARAYSNLGSAHHYKREYDKAIAFHNQVLNIAQELKDRTLEARAYAGLGHAARCMADFQQARHYHEKQLDNALQTKDKVAEGRACSNLGIIYQLYGEYDAALKLQKAHLNITKDLGDRASQGRAYGNIGNAYSSMGDYDLAVRFHKQELAISKEVNDRHSEASTHGNLAVAYQALKLHEKALYHYNMHLKMTQELRDNASEARALSNLGNYHSSRKDFQAAIPFYEQYLILSQELHDIEGEGKACHKLGYAHYCRANYKEAIRYYEQDLALAKEKQDKTSMSRAYCNLGLAHKALGDYPRSLEAQKYFLATAHLTKNMVAKFCALGNVGDVLIKLGELEEAAKIFQQQLSLGKALQEKKFEGTGHGNLGSVHRLLGLYDKALAFHTQELTIFQELNDLKGECRAHGNLGNVHMSLGNYSNAYRCYEEQLDRSRDLEDSVMEAQAYGNLGITKMNMGHFDDAIGLFEQQLALLEQGSGTFIMLDKGRAFGNLGDCYEALGDFEESVKCHEQYLAIALNGSNVTDQDKAYRGLGNAHRAMGSLQQALVCFEKRLVVAHELDKPAAKGSAYGELGCLHSLLGNFEQAISCLQNQLRIAQEMGDHIGEGDAACGLGGVYQQMAEYEKALEYHELDLKISEETRNPQCQCRAYGNLGLSHESLGNFEKAITYQEQHLSIAAQTSDKAAKTLAYSSLGRVHHAIGNYRQAVQYLQQGLQIAEQLSRREDEAKIRHRLGLALWGHGDLEESQRQLYRAAEFFESIRREAQISSDYKLSLFDLQTASYQALQRVLVALGRTDEALVVAERGRTRAFVDLLVERQQMGPDSWYHGVDSTTVTMDTIVDIVARQKAAVLYFSIAAGYLYSWLITPEKGVVKFNECSVSELDVGSDPEDTQSLKSLNVSTTSLLDQFVGHVRESLGIESHLSSSRPSLARSSLVMSETESEADDLWQQHLEELGDRLNSENDRTGFLRMVNRNHIFNSSSYSVSSLLSLGSFNGLNALRAGSVRSNKSQSLSGKPPLSALYDLLIAPMEEALPTTNGNGGYTELVLVLQGDLYLVPFSVLKGTQGALCLYERFSLLVAPSIRGLQASQVISKHNKYNPDCSGAVIVGNPRLPQSVTDQWQWGPLPGADLECKTVGEILGAKPLTGQAATKENVLRQLQRAEVIHFATHMSWKLAAIVLSPGEFSTATTSIHGNLERMELNDSSSDLNSSFDGPPLSDFLLTAADVLNVKVSAKLVVLSSGHSDERAGRINSDGVVGLTRAFLAAGAQCVLFSLWPVPEMATRILLKTVYSAMLKGLKCSRALCEGMRVVQSTRQFSHPANWASWVLVGSDVKLCSKVALMGHSLCQLLKNPSRSREAMRVVLHLVEKSLQRIHHGQRNAMYTTQHSIENKVGDAPGWKDLLTSVGFRFEPAANGLPAGVFFPTSDPGDRLTQCSASLQALLGLAVPTLTALSKLLDHQDIGEAVASLIREVNSKFSQDANLTMPIGVKLWRAPGCHEFLASLGFDLVDVGKDEVKVKAGKQASRRTLQFALQALVAIFDTQDAPRTLLLDSSSSMESLCSSGSATSTSNFSKGSSPPGSPTGGRRRSFFNPAEVDKLPSAGKVNPSQGPKGRQSGNRAQGPNISLHLTHQNVIRAKYSSPGSTSEDNDPGQSDDQAARTTPDVDDGFVKADMLPLATTEHGGSGRRGRGGGFERGGSGKGFYPPQPNNVYSTSASDSEDPPQGDGTLTRASASRSSVVSSSSTLTLKSTGSSAFRRTRGRSSVTSTKSSASDKTLTGDANTEAEQYCLDSQDGSSRQGKGDATRVTPGGKHDKGHDVTVPADDNQDHQVKNHDNLWSMDDESKGESRAQKGASMLLDPTVLARKVLAETRQERMALEHMQRLSIHTLQEKQNGAVAAADMDLSSDTDHQTSTSGLGSSLSSPQASSSSSSSSSAVKPIGCVAPSVQSTVVTSSTAGLTPVSVTSSRDSHPGDDLKGLSKQVSHLPTDRPVEQDSKVGGQPRTSFRQPVSALKPQADSQPGYQNTEHGVALKPKPPIPAKPKSVKFSDVVQENIRTPDPESSARDTSYSSLESSGEPYEVKATGKSTATHQVEPPVYGKAGGVTVRASGVPAQVNRVNPQCQTMTSAPQGKTLVSVSSSQSRTNIVQYSMNAQSQPVRSQPMVSSNLPTKCLIGQKVGAPGSATSRLQAGRMGQKVKAMEGEGQSSSDSQRKVTTPLTSTSTVPLPKPPAVGTTPVTGLTTPPEKVPVTTPTPLTAHDTKPTHVQSDMKPTTTQGVIDLKDCVINPSGFERYILPQGGRPPPPYPGPKMPGGAARPSSLASTSSLYSSASSNSPGLPAQISSISPPWYDSKSSDSEMSAVLESPSSDQANHRPAYFSHYNQQQPSTANQGPALKYNLPTYSTGQLESSNERGLYMQGAPVTYPSSMYGQDTFSPQTQQGTVTTQGQQTSVFNGRSGYIQNNFPSANTVELVCGPDMPGYASSESDVYGSHSTLSQQAQPALPPGGGNSGQSARNGRESPIYENIKWFTDIAKQVGYVGSRHSQSPVSSTSLQSQSPVSSMSIHSQSSSFSSTGYPATTPQYTTQSKPPPYNHAIYSRQQPPSYPRPQLPKSQGQGPPNPYPQYTGPPAYPSQLPVSSHKLPNQRPANYNLPNQRLPNYEPTNGMQGYSQQQQTAHFAPSNQRHGYAQPVNQSSDQMQLVNQRQAYSQVSNHKAGSTEPVHQQKGHFESFSQRPPPYNKVLEHLSQHGRPAVSTEDPLRGPPVGGQDPLPGYRPGGSTGGHGYGPPGVATNGGHHGYRTNGVVGGPGRVQYGGPAVSGGYTSQYNPNPRPYPTQNGIHGGESSGDSYQSSDQLGSEQYTMLQSSKC